MTAQATWPGLLVPAIGYALAMVQAVTPELLPHPTPCQGWDLSMLLRHASESLAALQEGIDAGRIGLGPTPDDPAADPAQVFCARAGRLLSAWTGTAGTGAGETGTAGTGTAETGTAGTGTAETGTAGTGTAGTGTAETGTAGTGTAETGTAETGTAETGASCRPEIIAVADRSITLGLMASVGALEMAVHGWDVSWACGRHEPIPGALATGLLRISPLLVPRTGRHPLFAAPVTVPPMASPSDQLVAYLGRSPQ